MRIILNAFKLTALDLRLWNPLYRRLLYWDNMFY